MIVDTEHEIIIGVDCYPANHWENDVILEYLKRQKEIQSEKRPASTQTG